MSTTEPVATGRVTTVPVTAEASRSAASPTSRLSGDAPGAMSAVVPPQVQVLEPFVRAGVFGPPEVHLAATLARLSPGLDDAVVLALAVAARGPRLGHVCVELSEVSRQVGEADDGGLALPWPDPAAWARALESSEVVADPTGFLQEPLRPLVWDGRRVYLQRYFHDETTVAASLAARARRDDHPDSESLTLSGADASAVASPAPSVRSADRQVTQGAANAPADATAAPSVTDAASLHEVLDELFGPEQADDPHLQRRAAEVALTHGLAVIVGGPGTGKTHTVARLLAAAHLRAANEGRVLQVALAAPTGKAASRMTEAVRAAVDELAAPPAPALDVDPAAPGDLAETVDPETPTGVVAPAGTRPLPAELAEQLRATEATTLHRLLGWAPGTRFRHDRSSPLPHDLVVVDETSMVALPLMARLLDAVRPDARLVLVGDPFQLASVEAGTVLGDVVGPALDPAFAPALDPALAPALAPALDVTVDAALDPEGGPAASRSTDRPTWSDGPLAGHVAVLQRAHRFREDSAIAALADAIRAGDADGALEVLDCGRPDASWVRDDDQPGLVALERVLVDAGVEVVMAALAGLAPAGLSAASRVKVLAATRHRPLGLYDWSDRLEHAIAARVPELQRARRWYVGRPVMVTANDPLTRVSNGDVGLVVARDDGPAVAFPAGDGVRYVPPSRLDRVETWWAMTIHKSQGSEFAHAVVSLPSADSPILTRELFYTAVTRARQQVTVVGSEASVRAAIEHPIARASGLRDRLWPPS